MTNSLEEGFIWLTFFMGLIHGYLSPGTWAGVIRWSSRVCVRELILLWLLKKGAKYEESKDDIPRPIHNYLFLELGPILPVPRISQVAGTS